MWDPDLQMDAQISQSKLTRTRSSLLRPSPTIRSSIHSLSSVTEEDAVRAYHQENQEYDEEKKIKPPKPGSTPRSIGSTRFTTVLTMVSLTFFSLFPVSFFFFFLLRREEIPTSVNLLLALIFIAITLFFANKNKNLINQSFSFIKNLWENSKKFGFTSGTNSKQVQWFIGDSVPNKPRKVKQNIREGVEFHSNGDFYEGEFHKGKCNGSGVYNYSLNGRYEGDWVDGRYDGYGIESWTRGSRYRGQYRRGLRHGFGVYRFYTGDSYAGEWFNGQSHGVGVQTCSDGSCYVGKFKCGVKHGLGAYHFRNGDRYAGEYFGDKIHGFGVYHFARGHCYEGSWHEGRNQGCGMYTYGNGDTRCGEWDAGTLKNPLAPSTDAILRAVQAARKTAENAHNLRRVDDQVNNAVTVANRAATAARVAAVKAVQNQTDGQIL